RFNYFDRSYKVIPQIGDADRKTVGPLLDLKIKTPTGQLVPVSTFTRIEATTAPRALTRFQQRNSVRVFGAVQPGVTKEEGLRVLEDAAAAVSAPGMSVDYAGESRQIRREGGTLTLTLGFAVILIYLVLAAQFRSFRDPLIVLLGSVPLAISGALIFSYLNLTTLNIYSQVGLITLVGLIAKNGILIVQFANTLQERGLAKMAALREATFERLVGEVVKSNHDVIAAEARLRGARAARTQTALDFAPTVYATASYTRQRFASASFPGSVGGAGPAAFPDQTVWDAGLQLS